MPDHLPVPLAGADYERKLQGWAMEALLEGEAVLKREDNYNQMGVAIDFIMGKFDSDRAWAASGSKVTENRFKKVFIESVSALTDIKPFFEYRTENDMYAKQAEILQKLAHQWWFNRNADLTFSSVMQYGLVGGTGFAHFVYDREWDDIRMIPEDPRDVLPIRPSSYDTIQDCYGVIIRRERTVNYLRQMYPVKAGKITAERDSSINALNNSSRAGKLLTQLGLRSGFMENLTASLANRPAKQMRVPVLDEYILYVKDPRMNTSSNPQWVGEEDPATDAYGYWAQPGEALYPRGRTINFTRQTILHDGPTMFWHGHIHKFPLVKYTIDPVSWSWLGVSPLGDLLPLQEELNKLLRVVSAHHDRVRQPGAIMDKNSVPKAVREKLDTARAGMKLFYNPTLGKPVEIVHEPALDVSVPNTIADLRKTMDELSGVADVRQLMNLNQIPTSETIERMMESMSLTIRRRSRVLEVAMRETAQILASDFIQFYNAPRRIAILGPRDGVTFEDFDFDPYTMVPVTLGGPDREHRSIEFMRQFKYYVAPGSLLAASSVTKKLLYLQLARAGWMDIETLFDVLEIPNPQQVMQRLQIQNMTGLQGQVNPAGRKASGQQMPTMRAGGNISESG